MAATYATIFGAAMYDGIVYAAATPLTSTEVDIFNNVPPAALDPIPVLWGQAIVATITLSITGTPDANSTYIVCQTAVGDNTHWVDLAWCVWTATTGSADFCLSAGAVGANAVQQTRAIGTAPSSNGSNQMPLGGKVRFTGKSTLTNGTSPVVTVTCRYKVLGLR